MPPSSPRTQPPRTPPLRALPVSVPRSSLPPPVPPPPPQEVLPETQTTRKISLGTAPGYARRGEESAAQGLVVSAIDYMASGIFVSAGTEGFNSLMKFASYKESAKVDAGTKLDAPGASDAVKTVNPQK